MFDFYSNLRLHIGTSSSRTMNFSISGDVPCLSALTDSGARMLCPVTRLQIEVGFEATKSSDLYERSLEAGGRTLCSAQ